MAISLGATSENLLKGIDRLIASTVSVLPTHRSRPHISRAWSSTRGEEIASALVDVSGGFPGNLRWQQHLSKLNLHLTDSWLIVGEGTQMGFTIPLDRISGVAVQYLGGLQPPSLVVWYQDADMIGSFLVTFRGTSRNRAGQFRAEYLHQLMEDLGITTIETIDAAFKPSLYCDWDDVADFADDEAIFTGRAIASAAGPFGAQLDTCDVWITEHAILWCPEHGHGLNCLPLDTIIDCRNGFGDRLSIGIEDNCGGRYDLYFDFGNGPDRSNPIARVKQVLAASGIPTGTAVSPIAPWRSGGTRRPTDI